MTTETATITTTSCPTPASFAEAARPDKAAQEEALSAGLRSILCFAIRSIGEDPFFYAMDYGDGTATARRSLTGEDGEPCLHLITARLKDDRSGFAVEMDLDAEEP